MVLIRLAIARGLVTPQRACVTCSATQPGHLFVVHGDLRRIMADDVLFPTRSLSHPVWFPDGVPDGARPIDPARFSERERVHRVHGIAPDEPNIWLGRVNWEGEGDPPLEWFLEAVEQFLEAASTPARTHGCGGRLLPLLALPVIGTGGSGGKAISGSLLSSLLVLLQRFVAERPVDVVLIAKSRAMLSAANAIRRSQPPTGMQALLEPRLMREARRLARLSSRGQLSLFLGSGTSRMAQLPSWSELLGEIGRDAGMGEEQLRQLRRLPLKEQANVVQFILGEQSAPPPPREPAGPSAPGAPDAPGAQLALQQRGRAELQRRAVARLRQRRYSVAHALLAALPHDAAVTTNSDLCYDAACEAAGVAINLLPYDTRASQRWLLKLHGDVDHPEDIVLTYSPNAPYGSGREALSGIVQALLITKHLVFVGFSLRDDAFNEIARDVRRALRSDSADRRGAEPKRFGTALTLSDRPRRRWRRPSSWGPFLAELWPELECVAMGAGVQSEGDYGARARKLQVFLDCMCLEASEWAEHILDPNLAGTLTADDLELKRELLTLIDALRSDPLACGEAAAAGPIKEMLRRLGCPDEDIEWSSTDEF